MQVQACALSLRCMAQAFEMHEIFSSTAHCQLFFIGRNPARSPLRLQIAPQKANFSYMGCKHKMQLPACGPGLAKTSNNAMCNDCRGPRTPCMGLPVARSCSDLTSSGCLGVPCMIPSQPISIPQPVGESAAPMGADAKGKPSVLNACCTLAPKLHHRFTLESYNVISSDLAFCLVTCKPSTQCCACGTLCIGQMPSAWEATHNPSVPCSGGVSAAAEYPTAAPPPLPTWRRHLPCCHAPPCCCCAHRVARVPKEPLVSLHPSRLCANAPLHLFWVLSHVLG